MVFFFIFIFSITRYLFIIALIWRLLFFPNKNSLRLVMGGDSIFDSRQREWNAYYYFFFFDIRNELTSKIELIRKE